MALAAKGRGLSAPGAGLLEVGVVLHPGGGGHLKGAQANFKGVGLNGCREEPAMRDQRVSS